MLQGSCQLEIVKMCITVHCWLAIASWLVPILKMGRPLPAISSNQEEHRMSRATHQCMIYPAHMFMLHDGLGNVEPGAIH